MSEKDLQKLRSSMTLLDYITNLNFRSLLIFRGYNEKLIKKIFTENKEFKIFNEILEKIFNGKINLELLKGL